MPIHVAHHPDDVEDVEDVAVDVEIVKVIVTEHDHQRRLCSLRGRARVPDLAGHDRATVEEVVEGRRGGLRRNRKGEETAAGRGHGRQAALDAIAVGPIHQIDAPDRRRVAVVRERRHDRRKFVDAAVVERRIRECRARVVDPTVLVGAALQGSEPQLFTAMRACRDEAPAPSVVADHPGRGGQDEQCQKGRQVRDRAPRTWPDHQVHRGHERREQHEVRPELIGEADEQARGGEIRPAPACVAERQAEHAGDDQDRADGVGGLRRRVDGVEREHAGEDRCHDRDARSQLDADQVIQHERNRGVEQHLHAQRDPRMIAEHAIPEGEKVHVAPHDVHRGERFALRDRQRGLVVEIDPFPSPRQRRPDEDEEEAQSEARQTRSSHARASGVGQHHRLIIIPAIRGTFLTCRRRSARSMPRSSSST